MSSVPAPAADSYQNIVDDYAKELLEHIDKEHPIGHEDAVESIGHLQDSASQLIATVSWPLNIALLEGKMKSKVIAKIASHFMDPTSLEGATDKMLISLAAIETPGLVLDGGVLAYKKWYIGVAKEELKKLKDSDPRNEDEIRKLEVWIDHQEKMLSADAKKLGITVAGNIPPFVKIGYVAAGAKIATELGATILELAGNVGKVILNGYKYWAARKYKKAHDEWVNQFKKLSKEEAAAILQAREQASEESQKPGQIKTYEELLDEELGKHNKTKTDDILKKRQATEDSRKGKISSAFNKFIYEGGPEKGTAFTDKMKENGIRLDKIPGGESIRSWDKLRQFLEKTTRYYYDNSGEIIENDEEVGHTRRHLLEKQYTDHRNTLDVMTKKALLGTIEGKHGMEGADYSRKVLIRATAFWASLIMAGLAIALAIKSTLIPGIAGAALIAICSTGFGVVALSFMVMVTFLCIFIWKRRHTLGTYFKLDQASIAFKSIPKSFRAWQCSRAENDLKKIRKEMNSIKDHLREIEKALKLVKEGKSIDFGECSFVKAHFDSKHKMLDVDDQKELLEQQKGKLEKELKAKKGKAKKIKEEIEEKEEQIKYWDDKIAPLKDKITQAGWKDYLKEARLGKTFQGRELDPARDITKALRLNQKSDIEIDDDFFDVLFKRMGLRPQYFEEFEKGLREFCAMSNEEMTHFIKHHKMELEMEKAEKGAHG